MIKFIWDIVRQLPAPILLVVGAILGIMSLWMLAHLNAWVLVGLSLVSAFVFMFAILRTSKKEPRNGP